MKYLLDTHTFLWSLHDERRLSRTVAILLDDPDSQLYLSVASLWEATIKIASGKMRVPGQQIDFLILQAEQTGVELLDVLPVHLRRLQTLPRLHGDPFDRMLVAQSLVEAMPLLSNDGFVHNYEAAVIW